AMPEAIAVSQQQQLRTRAQTIIASELVPVYQTLHRYLSERYIPNARTTIAAYDLPNGAAFYQQQIIDFVTEDLSPEDIHRVGLAQVAALETQMHAILQELQFNGSFAEFLAFLRSDPQFYAKTPEALLAHAAWIAKRVDAELPKYFNVLPRRPFTIAPVPAAIAPFYTAGRYVDAPEGSTQAGTYWVNTALLKSRPLYALPALTLHEAVPGHHLQIALAAEQATQPPFRRFSYISAFGEGWALYAEHLGQEMGIYQTPYERFGQLSYAMWRACRLVVDTGIHAKGWTRDQAIQYMQAKTALSTHEVQTEVDRYISWPGQALSYMLGRIRILALREQAQNTLGARFDLRDFHDQILALGSVPLPVLSAEMEKWIALQAQ
ncbi:DUF885 family protein, partial [bacterium]|nr:DUF885 family protein [bacterium]